MREYEQMHVPKLLRVRLKIMFPGEVTNMARLRKLVNTMDEMIYVKRTKK